MNRGGVIAKDLEDRMYGDLEQRDGRWQLRFTRRLAHPQENVWRALTEPEQLAAWFPTTIVGDRVVGAPLRFDFRDGEYPSFEGEMRAYEPPSRLGFRWGEDSLRFELRTEEGGTVLTLVDELSDHGKAARDGAGWHECLAKLDRHLDGDDRSIEPADRWDAAQAVYEDRFGPEASTIGPPEPAAKS